MTAATRTGAYAPEVGCRQECWTRLGNALGYSNTESKRSEIRDAVAQMAWLEPAQLAEVLDTAPARQVIASLFYGRAWALHSAALATLSADAVGRDRALIGLAAVTGERYVLLHVGYEVIELLHDTPTVGGVTTVGVAR